MGPIPRIFGGKRAVAIAGSSALLIGSIALAHWWTSGGRLPGPAPVRAAPFDVLRQNAECEGCHQEIAREWRGSQHQTAFADPTFQRAFDVEPTAFCRGCHAPESPGVDVAAGPATDLGVGCVSCHMQGEAVLAAEKGGLSFTPHRLERSAAFGRADACRGCHQFSFGDDDRREAPLPMQRTIDEHAASAEADTSCADCHMPREGGGHRSHAFASTRDPERHRRAIDVVASRFDKSLRLEIATRGVGHAYPTGDLFRRVAVTAEIVGPEQRSLASRTVYLGRHFGHGRDVRGEGIRVETRDDRLGLSREPTVIELDLGEGASRATIQWSVALERVLHQNDGMAASAIVEDSIVLASGSLPK